MSCSHRTSCTALHNICILFGRRPPPGGARGVLAVLRGSGPAPARSLYVLQVITSLTDTHHQHTTHPQLTNFNFIPSTLRCLVEHSLICQLYKGLRDKSKRIIACVSWNGFVRSFVEVLSVSNWRRSMFVVILNYTRLAPLLAPCETLTD